jgi:DNA helicase-2/ATP-dependent DNA helicase PcrA
MNSLKFKKELSFLNKEQREAVETINGPVMVVAGPGTGKTQILTLRIANILAKTDTSPENILALTFTESAATNIRKRIVGLIGTQGYYINISTFHGFCNQIIQDYPEKFSRIIGSIPATQVNKISILKKIIDSSHLKKIKPTGNLYYYIPALSKAIHDLKNEGIDYLDLKKSIKIQKKNITSAKITLRKRVNNLSEVEKNTELALVYDLYQKELRRQKLYDFEDMILETIKTLQKDKDFLLDLQEKYQYILVDEHQDTNGAQNKALELLSGYDNNPNLFIVGDEKQAIFRFQGASLENFIYFKNKFPEVRLINLKQNYRSTQEILDASYSLIEKNTTTLAIKLESQKKSGYEKIKICRLESVESECEFIADNIKHLLNKKNPANEIAVLFRENKDSKQISEALSKNKIPFAIESNENILEDNEIKKLNILFEAIENFANPVQMAKAIHLDFFGIDPIDIYKSLITKTSLTTSVEKIYKKIGDWKKLSYNVNFAEFFEIVAKESGFISNLLGKPNYPEKISKLNSLFKEAKKSVFANHKYNLSDYLKDLKILSEHNIPIKTKPSAAFDAVRLMTAHKAKGLEFDYVFIIGARNKHWGNKRDINLFKLPIASLMRLDSVEKNEDERRLFYMAITRARKEVFITYPATSDDGREYVPSQFISEIKPELKEEIDATDKYEDHILITSKLEADKPKTNEKTFVKDLFLSRGLSPTSLNNYLRCPWQFFYSNLLRLPQTPKLVQTYGTAKHHALQFFFNSINAGEKTGTNYLVREFEKKLKKQPINENDFKYLLEKGKTTLKTYHDFYKVGFKKGTVNEYKISGVDFTVGKEKIKLTGKLDKIELDSKGLRASVTDYKTRKPATRNWILGNTKDSKGDYFRQLVFYKLLLDSIPHKKFNMETGIIDFTEPLDSDRGKPKFKKEVFEISTNDVKNLRELIEKTADEILNLKFWDKNCDKKNCEFCALRKLLPKSEVI